MRGVGAGGQVLFAIEFAGNHLFGGAHFHFTTFAVWGTDCMLLICHCGLDDARLALSGMVRSWCGVLLILSEGWWCAQSAELDMFRPPLDVVYARVYLYVCKCV